MPLFDWLKRNQDPATLAADLHVAVQIKQAEQTGAEAPLWVHRLIRFLVSKWPTLLWLLISILEKATDNLSSEDRAEARWGMNRYRRHLEGKSEQIAKALEAK